MCDKWINLTTKDILWQKEVDNTFGWSNIFNINDEEVLIKSSGLYKINLKTGEGWDYKARTGESYFVGTYTDFESNLLTDSLNYYYASKNELACITHDGSLKWKYNLPEQTSTSSIIADSLTIYLINHGEIMKNNKPQAYGRAYVAAFDKATGQRKYLYFVNREKNPLIEYAYSKDTVELYFKDRGLKVSLKDGKYRSVALDVRTYGKMKSDASRFSVFIKNDSIYQNLHETDPESMFLITDKCVVQINRDFVIQRKFDFQDLFSIQEWTDELYFLYRNGKITVIDKLGHEKAGLDLGKRIFVVKDKLYAVKDNALIEVNLKDIDH